MKFEEWLRSVPEEMRGDSLWRVEAYRQQRGRVLREGDTPYQTDLNSAQEELDNLLQNIPLP